MARNDKLLERFKSRPKDFKWSELVRLLEGFGYKEIRGNGSRRKFVATGRPTIIAHTPHPGNVVKLYLVRQIAEMLENERLI
jgi:predicted RNA binding protein YcfA (HicA-like mRNA interferase family)